MSFEPLEQHETGQAPNGLGVLLRLLILQGAFGTACSAYLLLPKYLTEQGATAKAIGAVSAAMSFSVVLAAPLSAMLVERIERVIVIRLGIILLGASSFGFMATAEVGTAMILLRAMQGVAFSLVLTAGSALLVDASPPKRLGRTLGYLGATMLASQAVAPVLFEPLATRFGWDAVFLGAAAVSGVALISSIRLPTARPCASKLTVSSGQGGAVGGLVRACYVASLATGFAFGAVVTFAPAFALAQGASSISGLFMGYTVAALGVRTVGAGIGDTVGHARVAVLALTAYAVVVLGFVELRPALLPALGAGLGFAHGLLFPSLNAQALAVTAAARRGRVQAFFFGSFHLGAGLSGIFLGAIVGSVGFGGIFMIASAAAMGAAALLAWQGFVRQRTEKAALSHSGQEE